MSRSTDDPNICTECIGDEGFANWIRDHGEVGACEIEIAHGQSRKVVPVSKFAEEVDTWFRDTYTQGEQHAYVTEDSDNLSYEQLGDTYEDILMDELACSDRTVRMIAQHLPDVSHRDIAQGAEPFYDDTQNYEAIAAIEKRDREASEEYWYENRFRYQWQDFCDNVQYGRRFFGLKEPLDELFGDPKEYERGAITPLYMLPVGQKIFRARLIDDGLNEETLKQNPAAQLGAPPKELACAGRMNVEYIPVFYAAFSEETAVAEIRPGIGEQIAIGSFVLQRELRVFDFTAFARAGHERWSEVYAHTRYDFINQMEGEISKPILPFDRRREYIPTQVVAEYIKEHFNCDAIIYRSSMIKDRDKDSRNIVLLNRGEDFESAQGAPLAFSEYTAKEVINVTYELNDAWPF